MDDEFHLFGKKVPAEATYNLREDKKIGVSALRKADRDTQIEAMKTWFYQHFEDPAESTPYISSEGGYQFIHGRPYDAKEELDSEFEGTVPDEVIQELADELSDFALEWAPRGDSELDDYLYEIIAEGTEHYLAFFDSISNIRHLSQVNVETPQEQHYHRLLYLSAIIAFETYLSDNFITMVCSDPVLVRKFVEVDRHFSKGDVPVREVFKFTDAITERVKTHLLKIVWHRIADSQRMFLDTLGVTFPQNLEKLNDAIRVRHDIVHRSGKAKDGKEHRITLEDIEKVTITVEEVVWWMETQMNPQTQRLAPGIF